MRGRSQQSPERQKNDSRHIERTSIDMVEPVSSFESPRKAPMPPSRNALGCHISTLTTSKTLEGLSPALSDPAPPLPDRYLCRRISETHISTGNVRLFNTSLDFVANRLPEEHIQLANARKLGSFLRENSVEPDSRLCGGMNETPSSSHTSTSASYSMISHSSLHRSRSTSSLRLSAVQEAHSAAPPTLLSDIISGSSRQRSWPQTPSQAGMQHQAIQRTSQGSNIFYIDSYPGASRPPSHLPTAVRTGSGLFVGLHAEPNMPHKPSKMGQDDELEKSPIEYAREKLSRDRHKAELQWNEADRMLRELPQKEALHEGWEAPAKRYYNQHSLQNEDESIGKRLRTLWRNGTSKQTKAVRI